MTCQMMDSVISHNVIGQLTGVTYPQEIIVVGGHLDSWDVGEGAHDDGAGCVQSMEVLRTLKNMGIKPSRTIRAILYMNEENGMRGAIKYGKYAAIESEKSQGERHILALESDRGGFTPRGFSFDAELPVIDYFQQFLPLFKPFGLHEFVKGYGGVDISTLKSQGTVLVGFVPDSQRYFDHHHAGSDKLENVNKRELELGAAAITSFLWLVSEKGLPQP